MDELAASPTLAIWVVVLGLPLVLTLATAFTKSTVVLGALRVGLGAEAILPAAAVLGVALVVTGIVMAPTAVALLDGIDAAGGPAGLVAGGPDTWREAAAPLLSFASRHARADEVAFFAELQGRAAADPLVVIPAFLVTELTEALSMAVVILVPLLVVDLLVAQTLVLLGLTNAPTPLVTVPLKLLLFLSVGGWDLVLGGLVEGYR
jgi:flagellar biosynthesis protein FliP